MRRLIFKCALPDELFQELESAATAAHCSPAAFCAEALESVLAARRLPNVQPARQGPRPGHRIEVAVEAAPLLAETRDEA